MKRYFFHLQDGRFQPDLAGAELASMEAVRKHAIVLAASALSGQNGPVWQTIEWQITVVDDTRETVFTLNFYGESAEPKTP